VITRGLRQAAIAFSCNVLSQLSKSVSQLSIFPTTTLSFVILSLGKKGHAGNPFN
jgi:hypothetical protein